MAMLTPIVLCGGAGSRLWPLSRKNHPKQLLSLTSDDSLLQETLLRLDGIRDMQAPMMLCNEVHRFMVAEQARAIGVQSPRIILEPCAKNTAPAIAVAAMLANQDDMLLVLPADHQIKQPATFYLGVTKAKKLAEQGFLVTFGIHPEYAEAGYGYIKRGAQLGEDGFCAEQFVEKPDKELAAQYVQSGEYDWNSGMFMFTAEVFLQELQRCSPDIYHACQLAVSSLQSDLDFIRINKAAYEACPSLSVDYAVMEKSRRVAVVPLSESGWSDLGSWDAIYEAQEKDAQGNVCKGDVHLADVHNSYLHAENRLLAVVGVSDHIVVETADAVLVAHKSEAQKVKDIVSELGKRKRDEIELHRWVSRPWGSYEVIDTAPHFQVKRISVKPGASLSLQMHHHRSEHWVVIHGEAEVICGENEFILKENQSTYIPAECRHRLRNPGDKELVIIEVQTGSYLGEDDIVRFEDNYGREAKAC